MNVRNILATIKKHFAKISLKILLIGVGVLIVLFYGLIFFIPKDIEFSYANQTCTQQFLLAPSLQKANSEEFEVVFKDELRIGSVVVASGGLCVTPKKTLQPGTFTATISPFGGPIASKQVRLSVPDAPAAMASDFVGKAISTAKPLKIRLTSGDIIHNYTLKISDKTAKCNQSAAELSCDVASLKLDHGTEYMAALHRVYKHNDKKVVEGKLATLQPLVFADGSVKDGQVVYDKPTSFAFAFDQAVTDGEVTLERIAGDATEKVSVSVATEDKKITVNFAELAREAGYQLTINRATGENGSSLAGPVVINFTTSGGPKVTAVSVGASGVSRNARIIVTLDQPLDASVDLAKLARVEGVGGSVARQSDTQLAFTIQGGDCTPFTLVIDKGLKSASNGEVSKEAWKFGSRTVCGYSWSIGTSVKGRPIIAHSFGTGPKVILMTAAIHGSEPSSYTTMQAWVQHLQANSNIIPADKRIVIVPNTNPDGIAAGTRNNSRNVNLGRNFPTSNWQASIETASGTLPTGGGTSPGSEPEAAALMALTRQLRPRLQISFHAQGSLVGANKYGDSVAVGNIYASTVGYGTMYYNAEAVMGYAMTGEFEDWMGEEMGTPAILIELPRLSGNYFNSQLPALRKMLTL